MFNQIVKETLMEGGRARHVSGTTERQVAEEISDTDDDEDDAQPARLAGFSERTANDASYVPVAAAAGPVAGLDPPSVSVSVSDRSVPSATATRSRRTQRRRGRHSRSTSDDLSDKTSYPAVPNRVDGADEVRRKIFCTRPVFDSRMILRCLVSSNFSSSVH